MGERDLGAGVATKSGDGCRITPTSYQSTERLDVLGCGRAPMGRRRRCRRRRQFVVVDYGAEGHLLHTEKDGADVRVHHGVRRVEDSRDRFYTVRTDR